MPGWNASKPGSMSPITLETDVTPDDNFDPITGATELTREELEVMLWCCVVGLVGGIVLKVLWGV